MDISHMRQEYTKHGLKKADMDADPVQQFIKWFDESLAYSSYNNTATLATVNKRGIPSTRIVLLKKANENGFVFFTNYGSNKAKDIAENPHVSLLLFWSQLERQVVIKGIAEKTSKAESKQYFNLRPYNSQLGAWASHQSKVISTRAELEKAYMALKENFKEGSKVPAPDFWGGYRIKPNEIEFWQGRRNRLHDRFCYRHDTQKNWVLERLSP